MRKYIASALFMALWVSMLIGCVDSLKNQVEIINKQCPIDLGILGEVTHVDLDDRTIVYHVSTNPSVLNISRLKDHQKDVKQGILLNFSNDRATLANFIAAKCNLRYEYTDSQSDERLIIDISAEDLKNVNALVANPQELARKRVENFVTTGRLQLPLHVDEVTTLDDIIIEGDNVGYVYTLDETAISPDTIRERLGVLRENIERSLRGEDLSMIMLVDALTNDHKGLIYRYFLNKSKERFDITFTPEEIEKIMLGIPSNLELNEHMD